MNNPILVILAGGASSRMWPLREKSLLRFGDQPLLLAQLQRYKALGFSQALDGTWKRYKRETGRWAAKRTDFSDAIRFIAWYHSQSNRTNGIALNDTYRLYIAYYHGHAGYQRGNWSSTAKAGAKRAANMAVKYSHQLKTCGSW